MDPTSLVATVTLNTAGWLYGGNSAHAYPHANKAHEDLLRIVRRWHRHEKGVSRLPASLRKDLIGTINGASLDAIDLADGALEHLALSGVDYLDESPDLDDNVEQLILPFDRLPFYLLGTRVSLSALRLLRKLKAGRQATVARAIEQHVQVSNEAIALKFAMEDEPEADHFGRMEDLKRIERGYGLADAKLTAAERSMKADFLSNAAGLMHNTVLSILELPTNATSKVLNDVGQGMREAGGNLVQPLPIHPGVPQPEADDAHAAWQVAEDAGAMLRVLAIWLQAIAEAPPESKCPLCYRHRSPDGRRYCAEHMRGSGIRREARELHAARLLNLELERVLSIDSEVRQLLSTWKAPKVATAESRADAEAAHVRHELLPRAALLATVLVELGPVLEPSLLGEVRDHFGAMLSTAEEAFHVARSPNSEDRMRQRRNEISAPQWLGWDTFVSSWFGDELSADWLAQPKKGAGFDVAHPVVAGYAVAPTVITMDLLQQRVWLQATKRLDKEGYLGLHEVKVMRSGKKDGTASRKVVSFSKIAQKLKVSPETVRTTLKYASKTAGAPRRDRMPPKRRALLFGDESW